MSTNIRYNKKKLIILKYIKIVKCSYMNIIKKSNNNYLISTNMYLSKLTNVII